MSNQMVDVGVHVGVIEISILFRRLYATVLVLAILAGVGVYVQHRYYEAFMRQEVEASISLKLENIVKSVDAHLEENIQTIEHASWMLTLEGNDKQRLTYLEKALDASDSYKSIYYGKIDNTMLNASGWIPPPEFDLRQRPWYLKAVEEGKLTATSIYLNASKDNWIVTLAKPVYDMDTGKLLGVVGGDMALTNIVALLDGRRFSEHGYIFLLDENGELVTHSQLDVSRMNSVASVSQRISAKEMFVQNLEGLRLIENEGEEWYLSWKTVEETGWVIGSYVPVTDFIDFERQFTVMLWLSLCVVATVITLIFMIQRRYVVKPLMGLSASIEKIAVDSDATYRLNILSGDPFTNIRKALNKTLQSTQSYVEKLNESRQALELSESKIRAIVGVLPDMIFVYNRQGILLDCYAQDKSKLLMPPEEFIGKSLSDVLPESIAQRGMVCLHDALRTGSVQSFQYELMLGDTQVFFETRVMKFSEDQVIAIIRDMTDQVEYTKRIEHLSFRDQLTDLYNRRFYEEELIRLDTARNLPITVVMLDVNGLKLMNDAFGHVVGDQLLRAVADILRSQCRSDDIIARIGGDEFVILLPKTSKEDASSIVDRIHAMAGATLVENIPVSLSIGWATKETESISMTEVFVNAENRMYRRKLTQSQAMRNRTIEVIVQTLNESDPLEKQHSEVVSSLCRRIAEHMGLDGAVVRLAERAGLLHDIGKIAISRDILQKPESLNTVEHAEIRKHSDVGYQILKSADAYAPFAEYALSHHEWFNGMGYPRGLRGQEIPVISRIISVADAVEAMTTVRPFRAAMSLNDALDELEKNSGTQFDPDIVKAAIEILRN